ncbi:MAG: peptidylprolyl isomerase [Clostridia bacterium]|nr:peptidylprolyl isomerase [Clostridia bacterium]
MNGMKKNGVLSFCARLLVLAVCAVTALAPCCSTADDAAEADKVKIVITVRDYGDITCELYPDIAPLTVANFLSLADSGFYDGLTFHRIISGFMIQGGDPNGNGTGGSGVRLKGEFAANGFNNPLSHTRGVISMARARNFDSASSQFFIMHADGTYLDGQYAAFGRVLEGMEVVDAICRNTPVADGNGTVPQGYQPVIESIRRAE